MIASTDQMLDVLNEVLLEIKTLNLSIAQLQMAIVASVVCEEGAAHAKRDLAVAADLLKEVAERS